MLSSKEVKPLVLVEKRGIEIPQNLRITKAARFFEPRRLCLSL